jgi:hypothetical protein
MTRIKLTAFPLFIGAVLALSSCEKSSEKKIRTDFSKDAIVVDGAQETPATVSTALGTMDVYYTRDTRILSYTIKWSGLSGAVTSLQLQGPAPAGYPSAAVLQNIIASSGAVTTPSAVLYGSIGKYSGSVLIDGVALHEEDLTNGLFFMNIRTAAYPNGEIRAQIKFQ